MRHRRIDLLRILEIAEKLTTLDNLINFFFDPFPFDAMSCTHTQTHRQKHRHTYTHTHEKKKTVRICAHSEKNNKKCFRTSVQMAIQDKSQYYSIKTKSKKMKGRNMEISGTAWSVLLCFIKPILGDRYVRSLHRERAKGDALTIRNRRRPNLTLSPLDTWGVWILTLHLTTSLAIPIPSSSFRTGHGIRKQFSRDRVHSEKNDDIVCSNFFLFRECSWIFRSAAARPW